MAVIVAPVIVAAIVGAIGSAVGLAAYRMLMVVIVDVELSSLANRPRADCFGHFDRFFGVWEEWYKGHI